MQGHLRDLALLAEQSLDDLVSLPGLHPLIVIARVEVPPVVHPVLLHNILYGHKLPAATRVLGLVANMQACSRGDLL